MICTFIFVSFGYRHMTGKLAKVEVECQLPEYHNVSVAKSFQTREETPLSIRGSTLIMIIVVHCNNIKTQRDELKDRRHFQIES